MQPIDPEGLIPVPQQLKRTIELHGPEPACWSEQGGEWRSQSWADFGSEIFQAARALVALGLAPGDIVCIIGRNRREWALMAHAAMVAGCCPAGIYFTSSTDEIAYIVNHSECPLILCDSDEHLAQVASIRSGAGKLRHVVAMDATPKADDVLSWDDFLARGRREYGAELDKRLGAITLDDTGLLIYTSGTTGPSKAVVLSHRSAIWVTETMTAMTGLSVNERRLSYLPLAHIAEFNNTVLRPGVYGGQTWFVPDPLKMPDALPVAQPTLFFGVPRVWEKIEERISQKLEVATGIKAGLARWALRTGQKMARTQLAGAEPGPGLRLRHRIADRLVLSKVRDALGLSNCAMAISGAAPISVKTLEFFAAFGLIIYEVYGQSEDAGPATLNIPGSWRIGTVGRALPGVELAIAEDGEIMVRGPNVFEGYLKDPETTRTTLTEDGWLLTGDLGELDADGFLKITGRKKEILITAGGKNISPAAIEKDMTDIPLVEHAMLVGDGRKFISALISISEESLAAFAETEGLSDPAPDHPRVRSVVGEAIAKINPHYARPNQVHEFHILDRPLTQEAGELTPTLKMKRKVIARNHASAIEAIYAPSEVKEPS